VPPVRIYLDHSDAGHVFRFRRPDGSLGQIPGLRLKLYLNLSHLVRPGWLALHASFPFTILDTGAYLSIIPERVWSRFRARAVTPLRFDPMMPQSQRTITVAGGVYPYELAEVPIRVHDLAGQILDVTVVAQLTRDGGRLSIPVTLGLSGGILDGRILRAEPDTGAPFGQAWQLEEP
jgi:hypothetical protein